MAIYHKPIQNRDVWVDVHTVYAQDRAGEEYRPVLMALYRIDPIGAREGFTPVAGTYIKNAHGQPLGFDSEEVARDAGFAEAEKIIKETDGPHERKLRV